MDCVSVLYADDTTLIHSSPNSEHLRTESLGMETAVSWFEATFLIEKKNETANLFIG